MKSILLFSLCILGVTAPPPPDPTFPPEVEPAYLDMLLEEKRYDEFSSYLGIDNVELVIPKGGTGRSRHDAMRNKNLERGDILPLYSTKDEEDRQAIRMDKYRGSLWLQSPSSTRSNPVYEMPYEVSNQFSSRHRSTIDRTIKTWNDQVPCLKMVRRGSQKDYLFIHPGDGCWSYLGKRGGAQPLSLDANGCVYDSTILHEAKHAAGFTHEQNRFDRDNFIRMLWENIPKEWQDQYKKVDNNDYESMGNYDYYSIMHYPVNAPGTNKPAFEVLDRNIDKNRIGNGNGFTDEDIRNLNQMYCRTY